MNCFFNFCQIFNLRFVLNTLCLFITLLSLSNLAFAKSSDAQSFLQDKDQLSYFLDDLILKAHQDDMDVIFVKKEHEASEDLQDGDVFVKDNSVYVVMSEDSLQYYLKSSSLSDRDLLIAQQSSSKIDPSDPSFWAPMADTCMGQSGGGHTCIYTPPNVLYPGGKCKCEKTDKEEDIDKKD